MKWTVKHMDIYSEQMAANSIRIIYSLILDNLKDIKKDFPSKYKTGVMQHQNLENTYFTFFSEEQKKNKVKFAVVLNHENVRHELWVLGNNVKVQNRLWNILKDTSWNIDGSYQPYKSATRVIITDKISLLDEKQLRQSVIKKAVELSEEIYNYIKLSDFGLITKKTI